MSHESENKPSVSGISPYEGPPGTKITIRGHNLGKDASDLVSVHVCNADCTSQSQWVNSGKIICVVDGIELDKPMSGPVIVKTKSGGVGNCVINYNVLFSRLRPLMVSSVWIDEELEGLIPGYIDVSDSTPRQAVCESDPFGLLSPNILSSGQPRIHQTLIQYSSKLVDHNFHPVRFLLERHPNTKWEQLKKGFEEMQKTLNLTSNSDLKNSSSYLTNNVTVVINVISDMHKLSKLINEKRFTTSDDLKIKIDRLNNKISNDYKELSQSYSLMTSRIQFFSLYKTYEKMVNIPKEAKKCIKTRTNYMELMTLCIQFYQMDRVNNPKLLSILETIDGYINRLITHTIDNLVTLYPLHFPCILEFLKTIECFNEKLGQIMLVMKSHQTWLNLKFNTIKDSFIKTLNKNNYFIETFNASNKDLVDFCENVSSFILHFCQFFIREFDVVENMFYSKNITFRKSVKLSTSNNSETVLNDLIDSNDIFNKYIELFFSTLYILLFHPWSVLGIQASDKSIFCSMTSINIQQIIRIFNSITNIANTIKSSKVLEISLFSKYDRTSDKFHFTFQKQFSYKFHTFLFDSFQILQKYYFFKLSAILTPPINYDPHNYKWIDSFDIPLRVYSYYYDWLLTLFEIFTMIKTTKVFDYSLSSKFALAYPHKSLYNILRDQIDSFISSSKFSSFHAIVSYYSFLVTLKSNLTQTFSSKKLFKSVYEHAPFPQDIFIEDIIKDLDDIDKNLTENLLIRACELLLTPIIKIIKPQYLTKKETYKLDNFYTIFIDILLLCCQACLKLHSEVYKNTIMTLINLFYKYLNKNLLTVILDEHVSTKLYKNIFIITSFLKHLTKSTVFSEYTVVIEHIQPSSEEIISKINKKTNQILTKYNQTLQILIID